MHAVDVILPVLNEAEALPWVLGRLAPHQRPIVVDNGSSDGSATIAAGLGAAVVREAVPGFGSACFAGLQAAKADLVAFMDCDGSLDPRDLDRVVSPVAEGRVDMLLGARQPERGAWPLHAQIGNRVVARRVRCLTGYRLRDLGPMRACHREALFGLALTDRRSGWPLEMVLRARAAGWRVEEVPVPYYKRSGRSKVTGTVGGTVNAVRDMRRQLAAFESMR